MLQCPDFYTLQPALPTDSEMKVYNLNCNNDHAFEGWFSSAEDFQTQSEGRRIACPLCGSFSVKRVPSAARLNLIGAPVPTELDEAARNMRESLKALARHVIENTEDVGEAFAEEARKIHYKETPERAIRGVATSDEREALADEGIDVVALPIKAVPKSSLH
jgi:hypothetical protein